MRERYRSLGLAGLLALALIAPAAAVAPDAAARAWGDRLAQDSVRLTAPDATPDAPPPASAPPAEIMAALFARATGLPADQLKLAPAVRSAVDRGGEVWSLHYTPVIGGRMYEFGVRRRVAGIKPLYLTVSSLPAQPAADFEAARRLVASLLLTDRAEPAEFSGWLTPLDSAHARLVTWGGRAVHTPWTDYWLFFIDDAPAANWAHPCRYVFVARDLTAVAVQYALTPLTVESDAPTGPVGENLPVLIPYRAPARAATPDGPPPAVAGIRYDGAVSNCYAVIVSGGYDTNNNHIRYWGDAAFIYSTLTKKYGYSDQHIFALIADGTNPAIDRSDGTSSPVDLDGDGDTDIDNEGSAAAVSNTLVQLRTILNSNDQLFVFFTDHGGPTAGGGDWDTELNLWMYQVLRDVTLKKLTTNFPCPVLFVMEQCFSGGFINDLNQPQRVIATAAPNDASSWAGGTSPTYDQWCYYWTAAMRGFYPGVQPWLDGAACDADANRDGYVSFQEASAFAYTQRYYKDIPQYFSAPTGLGARVFLVAPPAGPLGIDHYVFNHQPSPQTTGQLFAVQVAAVNVFDSLATGHTARAALRVDPWVRWTEVGPEHGAWAMPFPTYYHDARTQVIYLTNELGAAKTLRALAVNIQTKPLQMLSNCTIRIKHTPLAAYPPSPGWESDGWTTVYQAHPTVTSTGWIAFVFTNTFAYNGVSNLLIDFSFNNSAYTENGISALSSGLVSRTLYYTTDSGYGNPLAWSGDTPPPQVSVAFPAIRLGSAPPPPAVAPTNLPVFTNGCWAGQVAVAGPATAICLRVTGTNANWSGISETFHVLSYPFSLTTNRMSGAGTEFVLRWRSVAGAHYTLLYAPVVADGFQTLRPHIAATPPQNVYTDQVSGINRRFYCVAEE